MPLVTEIVNGDTVVSWQMDPEELEQMNQAIPKSITVYKVKIDPPMYVVPCFLSNSEIDYLMSLSEGQWKPAGVSAGKESDDPTNYKGQISEIRTSEGFALTQRGDQRVLQIEHRIANVAGVPHDRIEVIDMLRYLPGQFFKRHHDGNFRQKSCVIYMNDIAEGGGTYFPELNLRFKPTKGMAVLWSNIHEDGSTDERMEHEAEPLADGVKYACNCFMFTPNVFIKN